jgi:hypothetical protein
MNALRSVKLLVIVLLISSSWSLKLQAQTDSAATAAIAGTNEDTVCLKIKGLAICEGKPLDGVNAKLYKENDEMEMVEVTSVSHHSHDFFFNLAKNSYYTIEISKPGYITRMISISTKLPQGVKVDPIFEYEIELEMHKERQGVDDYYLDFPIALIDYDPVKDVFVSHGKYTAYIKAKIKETLEAKPDKVPQKKN